MSSPASRIGCRNLPIGSCCRARTPQLQAATNVVVSQFRTSGPKGLGDEFVEIFNPTINSINISGWKINGSNSSGATSTRYTFPAATNFLSGQYLIANNSRNGYSGSVTPNGTSAVGIYR